MPELIRQLTDSARRRIERRHRPAQSPERTHDALSHAAHLQHALTWTPGCALTQLRMFVLAVASFHWL